MPVDILRWRRRGSPSGSLTTRRRASSRLRATTPARTAPPAGRTRSRAAPCRRRAPSLRAVDAGATRRSRSPPCRPLAAARCSDDAIAARGFGLVHPAVGGAKRRLEVVVRVELGGAGGNRDAARRQLLNADANAFGQLPRRLEIRTRQDDQELLTAPARDDVVGADRLAQHRADLAQHL